MDNDLHFIVSDYYATGEGRTISMLVMRPSNYWTDDDWEVKPTFDENWKYIEGTPKPNVTNKVIADREFNNLFGEWYALGATNISKEEFLTNFGYLVPDTVKNFINPKDGEFPPALYWQQQLHFNFS